MPSDRKSRIREEALEEARLDEEMELRTARKLRRFQRATLVQGVLLGVDVALVSQFLKGHQWYGYWEPAGSALLILAGGLLSAFMFTAALTYGLWGYLRSMTRIHKKYAPPLSKHRTGR